MRVGDLYGQGRAIFSFEFFPPKTDAAVDDLLETVRELKEVSQPDFVSVTYGAGGSTRSRTLDCVARIQREAGVTAMAHLACLGHEEDEIAEIVSRLTAQGIENVLALRGDQPKNGEVRATSLRNATDLMAVLQKRNFGVDYGGACYPEPHPQAANADDDLHWARVKVDLGARFLMTQLFFNNDDYFRYVDRARAAGVNVPIVPGIMPITNVAQIERITKMCGATIPAGLRSRLEPHREDAGAVMAIGMEHAIGQCRALLQGGAPGLHFYTLNKSLATRVILAAVR
ncbi:MAG: methylenetetrahydrofolate reductase [NAD(P)H] [Acidobacteria bacterium]|nr:methylenetetrahydrofolate reductase [NAD(P)H] [Acidobacteriota bacterium]